MFSRTNYTNPFQSFGFGAPQPVLGPAFGGINQMVPQMMNPYVNIPSTYISGIGAGLSPWSAPFSHMHNLPLPQGLVPQLGLVAAQFGVPLNLMGLPYAQQPYGITAYGHPGIQLGFNGPGFNGQGFSGLVPSLLTTPTLGVDPIVASAISQQTQALLQSQLPVRPLINPYQSDPFQFTTLNQPSVPYQIGSIFGGPLAQAIDPSTVVAQANLAQQGLKQPNGAPWTANAGIPFWSTQAIPTVQGGFQACP
jgi:hypothetical protein